MIQFSQRDGVVLKEEAWCKASNGETVGSSPNVLTMDSQLYVYRGQRPGQFPRNVCVWESQSLISGTRRNIMWDFGDK